MKYLILILLVAFTCCKGDQKNKKNYTKEVEKVSLSEKRSKLIELDIRNFDQLEELLNKEDNKVHIVNFWATWCGPCVKELPHFEEIYANYKDSNVEVLLVSLDFPSKYEKSLKPFLIKHNIQSQVVVLDDPDMDTWLPKVDTDWDGAIPVTLIYSKTKRELYKQTFTYSELEDKLKQFLN